MHDAAKLARNANLATFVTSCFGSGEVGFYHLNEYFLETFVNDGSRLLKQQAGLYLELKTQAYLSAMSNEERPKGVVLDELFPEDLETRLLGRRAGAKTLHPSEHEFLEKAKNRRRHLEAEPEISSALDLLKDRYKWDSFLSDLANYLNKNFEAIVGQPLMAIAPLCDNIVSLRPETRREDIPPQRRLTPPFQDQPSPHMPPVLSHHPLSQHYDNQPAIPQLLHRAPPPPPAYYYPPPPPPPPHLQHQPMPQTSTHPPSLPMQHGEDIVAKAQRAAQEAFQGYSQPVLNGLPVPSPVSYQQGHYGPSQHGQHSPSSYNQPPPPPQSPYGSSGPPHAQIHQHHGPPSHPPYPPSHHPYYNGPPQGPIPPPHQASYHPSGPHQSPPHFPPRHDDPHFIQNQYPPIPAGQGAYYHPHPGPPPNFQIGLQVQPHGLLPGPNGQSLPTAILYEKARAVANSKSSSGGKNRPSNVSQRRPWTTEEEQALMAGLDQVKGPHWSQILALYGPGGTISEALRDRTQVQLKDKARNLKLFFLKSKIEVPYYLGFVTGELKSRAPSHVAYEEGSPSNEATPENGTARVQDISDNVTTPTSVRGRPLPSIETQTPLSTAITTTQTKAQENGAYASPYAAIPPSITPQGELPKKLDEPVNRPASPRVVDLATTAADAAARAIASMNGQLKIASCPQVVDQKPPAPVQEILPERPQPISYLPASTEATDKDSPRSLAAKPVEVKQEELRATDATQTLSDSHKRKREDTQDDVEERPVTSGFTAVNSRS
jgi:protein TBF1